MLTGLAIFGGTMGPGEMLVVLTAVLILFGARRLPEMARKVGRIVAQLRDASDEVRRQIMNTPEDRLDSHSGPASDPMVPSPSSQETSDERPG